MLKAAADEDEFAATAIAEQSDLIVDSWDLPAVARWRHGLDSVAVKVVCFVLATSVANPLIPHGCADVSSSRSCGDDR